MPFYVFPLGLLALFVVATTVAVRVPVARIVAVPVAALAGLLLLALIALVLTLVNSHI